VLLRGKFYSWKVLHFSAKKYTTAKHPNFSILFPLGQKNLIRSGQKISVAKPGWPIIISASMFGLGWVRAHFYLGWDLHS